MYESGRTEEIFGRSADRQLNSKARMASGIIGFTLRTALTRAALMMKKVPDKNARKIPYHLFGVVINRMNVVVGRSALVPSKHRILQQCCCNILCLLGSILNFIVVHHTRHMPKGEEASMSSDRHSARAA